MSDDAASQKDQQTPPATDSAPPPPTSAPFYKNIWFERVVLCLLIVILVGGWHVYRRGWWFLLPSLPDPETTWEDDAPARRLAEALNLPPPPDMSKLDERGAKNLRIALHNLRGYSKDARSYGELGRVYEAQGATEGALHLYKRAAEMEPKQYMWHYHAGLAALGLKSGGQAREAFKKAIELKPDYTPAYLHLGDLALEAGNVDEAQQMYEKYLAQRPGDAVGLLALARLAWAREDWPGVIERVKAAQAAGKTGRLGHQLLASAYSRMNQQQEAQAEFRLAQEDKTWVEMDDPLRDRVRELRTSLASVIEQYGMLYGQGRFHEALECAIRWKDATAGQPDQADAWMQVAECHRQLGQNQEALIAIAEALKLAPDNADAHCVHGQILLAMTQLVPAVIAAEEAINLKDNYIPGHLLRAQVLLALAVQDPKKLRAAGIGRTPMEMVDKAAEDARLAVESGFAKYQALMCLGLACAMNDDYAEAASHFQEALKLHPDSPETKRLLKAAENKDEATFWPNGRPKIVMKTETAPESGPASTTQPGEPGPVTKPVAGTRAGP